MSDFRFSRRGFLERAGVAGGVPLIGTLMAAGPFQARAVPQLKGKSKSVVIPTHEFAGPNGAPWIEERKKAADWGNARSMRTLLEKARESQAIRISTDAGADLSRIETADLLDATVN